jgi:DNA-directed RNA polymerase subunit M/transcription elongation factor TFIIS
MEKRGYYPVSQEWIPGSYGCFAFLIAFLLCFIFIGIVAFLYMLIVKPDGKLIVTYEIRKNDEVKVIDKIQKIEQVKNHDASEKTCPMCGETVKEVALICRFCNYDFYDYYCSNIMRESGLDARVTPASGDQGIDVIARKGNIKVVLQCKKYSQPVGNKAVQEVFAGKNFEKAQYAAVVTNSTYTPSAKQLAASTGVYLLHDTQLEKFSKDLISYLQKNNK